MLVRESLYNFKREQDIIKRSGLGKISLIEKWLHYYNIKNYVINEDFTIDIINNDDVLLNDENLEEIPEYIKFNKIRNGLFTISDNKLKNLIGCPIYVKKHFVCSYNPLYSLEGMPQYIGGNLYVKGTLLSYDEIKLYIKNNNINVNGSLHLL